MLASLGAALAMLGPGVRSVDARLFGRKRSDIPDRWGRPHPLDSGAAQQHHRAIKEDPQRGLLKKGSRYIISQRSYQGRTKWVQTIDSPTPITLSQFVFSDRQRGTARGNREIFTICR